MNGEIAMRRKWANGRIPLAGSQWRRDAPDAHDADALMRRLYGSVAFLSFFRLYRRQLPVISLFTHQEEDTIQL